MCARTATRCSPGPLRPTPAVRSCYVQALTRKYVVHTVFRKGGFFSPVGMAAATFPGCKARGGALPLAAPTRDRGCGGAACRPLTHPAARPTSCRPQPPLRPGRVMPPRKRIGRRTILRQGKRELADKAWAATERQNGSLHLDDPANDEGHVPEHKER